MSSSNEALIELYNLQKDIAEEHNVAGQQPHIIGEMKKIIKTARTPSK